MFIYFVMWKNLHCFFLLKWWQNKKYKFLTCQNVFLAVFRTPSMPHLLLPKKCEWHRKIGRDHCFSFAFAFLSIFHFYSFSFLSLTFFCFCFLLVIRLKIFKTKRSKILLPTKKWNRKIEKTFSDLKTRSLESTEIFFANNVFLFLLFCCGLKFTKFFCMCKNK